MPGCLVNGECVYSNECSGKFDWNRCPIETRPNRKSKRITTKVANHLKNITGYRPHVVVMNLHRTLVDADANRDEGAQNDVTRSVWYDFHNFISIAKTKVKGKGLLIDIHSHKNMHGLVELSYGIEKSKLTSDNHLLDMTKTSLRSLTQRNGLEDFIRGVNSLGGLLQRRHIESVPSPSFPSPTFSMGYTDKQTITKVYGSLYGGIIDAVRVSVPKKYCVRKQIKVFSKLLAESIHEFVKENDYST